MAINSVSISGNLTRDPQLRRTQSGMAVLNLGVAVNDRRKDHQTGQWEDDPQFVDCVMFGSRAEAVDKHLSKGSNVAIQGKLRYRSWTGRDGGKHSKLEVAVDEIEFMSRGQQQAQQPPQAPQQTRIDESSSIYDDDCPF